MANLFAFGFHKSRNTSNHDTTPSNARPSEQDDATRLSKRTRTTTTRTETRHDTAASSNTTRPPLPPSVEPLRQAAAPASEQHTSNAPAPLTAPLAPDAVTPSSEPPAFEATAPLTLSAPFDAGSRLLNARALHSPVTRAPPREPIPAPLESEGISAYELERLRNIRENEAALDALGLGGGASLVPPPSKPSARRRQPRERPPPAEPLRRSTRSREPAATLADLGGPSASAGAIAMPRREEPSPPPEIDYSRVLRYLCSPDEPHALGSATARTQQPAEASRAGWRRAPTRLQQSAIKKIYSLSSRPECRGAPLLAAAGHEGMAAVWPIGDLGCLPAGDGGGDDEDDALPPLVAWKAHKGWIGEVQFATAPVSGTLLLSCANDKLLTLWDLERSGGHQPKQLTSIGFSSGLFSLHEVASAVLVASKGGDVGLCRLRDGGRIELETSFEQPDGRCVRSTQWQPRPSSDSPNLFAAGSDAGAITLWDARERTAAATLSGAHASAVNTLRWSDEAPHLLLSASNDPTMLLHDVRKMSAPVHHLKGHAAGSSRARSIIQPAFCAGGSAVVTVGEGSPYLSMYCARTGEMLSQGELGEHRLTQYGSCLHVVQAPSRAAAVEALVLANDKRVPTYIPYAPRLGPAIE